jgi:hypothetical protein
MIQISLNLNLISFGLRDFFSLIINFETKEPKNFFLYGCHQGYFQAERTSRKFAYKHMFKQFKRIFIMSSIFWDITPRSLLEVNRRFGGMLPHRASSACHLLSCWFLAWLILQSCRQRQYVPPKCLLTFIRLHGVVSPKTELFITTVVRTVNPAIYL